ncbi:MAG: adenylyl-sulfate kinase [Verrucomicrobiota bacterium]
MKPVTFWITGQPGSGKTTIGRALTEHLRRLGLTVVHLDGDDWRSLSGNIDYSAEGRKRNVLSAQSMAAKLNESGVCVVASFVSPIREMRENFKAARAAVEIYTHTTDLRGREGYFVKDYQPPESNFIDLDTTGKSVPAALEWLLECLKLNR